MDEQNSLAFDLRARILPQIEGADQLIQQAQQLPQSISTRMQQTVQSAAFQEGLTPSQRKKAEEFAGFGDMFEFQKFQEKQKEIFEELDVDLQAGKLTKAQKDKYRRKFARQKTELEEFNEELTTQLNEPYFDFLGLNRKKMLMGALNEGTREAIDNAGKLNGQLERVVDNISKSSNEARTLFDQLKSAGVLSFAGSAINMGLDYWVKTEQIKGAERTSFDFSSPMSMYARQKQFEAYQTTMERMRDYQINGAGIGLAGGLGLAAFAGVTGGVGLIGAGLAGMYFGSSIGGKIASGKNIETQTEMEEQLKRRQEVYSQLSSMVSGSSQYDILRSRTRARIGSETIGGSLDLGYGPSEELQMRNVFSDARGKYDPQLYKEQTTFARAEGIDPTDIYKLNLSARMTGMDVGISGLDQARQLARMTYGEGFSNQRVVDILNDIKNLNERLLQTNVDMDSRDALRISVLPNMIFGNESPYGRLGEKAGESLQQLQRLGQPQSLAHEAFLFSAYGETDILKFTERMRKGALDPENMRDIIKAARNYVGGNRRSIEIMLNGIFGQDVPAGFVPDFADSIMSGEDPTKENLDKKINELQKKYGKNLTGYGKDAEGAVSETEANRKRLEELGISIGDNYRKLINKMSVDWLTTWQELSTSMNNRIILENQLNGILTESITRFKQFFLEGNKTSEEFEKWRAREKNIGGMYQPKEIDKDSTTGKSLRNLENKLQLQYSDSYESWKNRNSTIKDAHGKDATGFVKEKMLELQKALSESPLGMRYRTSLYEGEATTGHAPGSPHYTGKAFDVSLYDKLTYEKILKENYPQKIRDFFHEFASGQGLTYGGDWRNPDTNHFQVNSAGDNKNANLEIDYDRLAGAITNALSRERKEDRIVIEDRTRDGIQSHRTEKINSNANFLFGY